MAINNTTNLLVQIANVLNMTEDEKRQLISDYNDNLNIQFVAAAKYSAEDLNDFLAKYPDDDERLLHMFEEVKDKTYFQETFGKSVSDYHATIFRSFLANSNEDQKRQLAEYIKELSNVDPVSLLPKKQ